MKLIHQALIAGSVLAGVGFAGTAQAASLTFIAGREDNFAVIEDKEPEPAYASDRLKQLPTFIKDHRRMNFDEPGYDTILAKTFTWSQIRIIDAQLRFRAKVSQGGACNDRIRLGFSGDPNPVEFFSFLGAWNDAWGDCNRSGIGPGQELLRNNSWGEGPLAISDYTFTIPLQPALIAKMNQKSYLDVWGEDDTMFDYFLLTVNTAPDIIVSLPSSGNSGGTYVGTEPSTYFGTILAFGALGAVKVLKRQQKNKETFTP